MTKLDRFKKRKEILKNSSSSYDGLSKEDILFMQNQSSDFDIDNIFSSFNKRYEIQTPEVSLIQKREIHIMSDEEVDKFLDDLRANLRASKIDKLLSECKTSTINSIITPFGLGKIMAAYDKVGGNVDTIHNARNGVYATKEAKEAYENRGEYDSHKYHSHKEYNNINKGYSQDKKAGNAIDYMSGKKIDLNEKTDLDHITPAKEIHDDPGRVLAGIDGADLANQKDNLALTSSSKNRSKKADSMKDFIDKRGDKFDDLDKDLALKADQKARDKINSDINKKYYTSKDFIKNTAMTSLNEASKMGLMQASGIVLVEFFSATFEEIKDCYKNGYSIEDKSFFETLKVRLLRIINKIKARYKDIGLAFIDGGISGFLSNLVTTFINAFMTTSKRLVRILREGIFSLFRAFKILISGDGNFEERLEAAKKLIITGGIISVSVIVEEIISKLIHSSGFLSPFADTLTAIFVGAFSGIAIACSMYWLDRKKEEKEFHNELMKLSDDSIKEAELAIAKANEILKK